MDRLGLDMQTLAADLAQSRLGETVVPGSISTKQVRGQRYVYAVERDGIVRRQRALGKAGEEAVEIEAHAVRAAELRAKGMRRSVSMLKRAGLPAPDITTGRVLEVIANAGLFDRGMALVGTQAFRAYALVLGVRLQSENLRTRDVDFSVAELAMGGLELDLADVLQRADPTFAPVWHPGADLPTAYKTALGFSVDLVTQFGRGRRTLVAVKALSASAEALSFQNYLTAETLMTVALHGRGVPIRVPDPLRFGIHKLLVAACRPTGQRAKAAKDLAQAVELLDAYLADDPDRLADELADARGRGRAWATAINSSLKQVGRVARAGALPHPLT
ncbi:MAG: GSU2403 family nucleotidyltransferase fold protein [Pseudomonadota bacterium]